MTKPRAALLSLALCLASSARAAGDAGPGPVALRISGTGAGLGTMKLVADAYLREHPEASVVLLPSVGSSGAIQAVAEGALDIGLSARALRPEERARGLVERPYARTPFVLAAGAGVDLKTLDAEELARIYAGERKTWPNGERVRVVLRPASDADTALLRSISPRLAAAVDAALGRQGMLLATTNQECTALLARTRGGIGPSTLAQLRAEGSRLRAFEWGGVAPTTSSLAAGTYPLAHTLSVVVRARPPEEIRRFLAFLGSPRAAELLLKGGALPVPLARLDD